ncbi:lysosomal Pro-X carboxypeptidase-like [Manduca sexta]|uniref:lysosomal Pro-X carboxypeptidase-like n=1 Tax=Manduca sexta TaxID=7130 RepID=UPI00188FB73D|nr:lysosomal Pro-X carboxypeptidase-like [Manduca sexta]
MQADLCSDCGTDNSQYGGTSHSSLSSPSRAPNTKWCTVPLDHFGFATNTTFKIKYLECDDYWDMGGGPIFFYTGNELLTHAAWSYVACANTSQWLRQSWNLCGPTNSPIDVEFLVQFLKSMYVRTAMVNYPYASDYVMPLPAEPVEIICQYLNESLTDKKLLEAIGKVILVFVNNQKECLNYTEGASYRFEHIIGWSFQACTEIITPMCATGVTDMFEPSPWSFAEHVELCHNMYDVYPRHDMARIEYGGARLEAASNIVFSNGLRDPWAAGGILKDINDSVKAVVLDDAAHHLDLMASNPADPPSVKMARHVHKDNIRKWINEFNNNCDNEREAL